MRLAALITMPTNDVVDPTVQEADQRAERAKASLISRATVLKDKLIDARDKLDLPAQIAKHPLPSVGIAFMLGMIAGRLRTGRAAPPPRSLTGAAFAALAGFGLRLLRDAALVELSHAAQQWWAEHDAPAAPGPAPRAGGDPLQH